MGILTIFLANPIAASQFLRIFFIQLRCAKYISLVSTDCSTNIVYHKHCQRHNGPEGWVHLEVISQVQTEILIKFIFRILTKYQLLSQTSASPKKFKFKILTKPSFRISAKIQLHNLYKTSAAKCWTNSIFEILPKLQLQNLDQPLCSKSERKFSFMTKRQLQNQQAVANMILSINISNSNNLNKFWVGIFTRQGHINQVY